MPYQYKDDHQLGNWIVGLRFRKDRLTQDRITRLEKLGFQGDLRADKWEISFEKLKSYKDSYGHCRVPITYTDEPKLHSWVRSQRRYFLIGSISKVRIARLEVLRFEWDPHTALWEENFGKLQVFKAEHGHCRVTRIHKDPQLATWVGSQRSFFRSG